MPYYRFTITPLSPLGTKLVSGTLWGHLAWAIRYKDGEEALKAWLSVQEEKPWLLSSFMPKGMVPRPLLQPSLRSRRALTLEEMREEKKVRKGAFIPEELFITLRTQLSGSFLENALKKELKREEESKKELPPTVKPHNRIDRLTSTTPESGGLFFEEVQFFQKDAVCQGFAFTCEPCLEMLKKLFDFVGENGFGSNASTGNGHFRCTVTEETSLFNYSGNRAMSLSHGVVSDNMRQLRYKQHVHFGKLGAHYSTEDYSPFKYPILMMCPGMTFEPVGQGPFGKLLNGVHHDSALSSVRHHALHLPLLFTEVHP